jgi:hypothetical protein
VKFRKNTRNRKHCSCSVKKKKRQAKIQKTLSICRSVLLICIFYSIFFFTSSKTLADTNGVSIVKSSTCDSSVSPSGLPAKDAPIEFIEFSTCLKMTVGVENTTFVYDKTKWKISVASDPNLVVSADAEGLESEPAFDSGETREGKLKFRIKVPNGKFPESWLTKTSSFDGRTGLGLKLFYSDSGSGPGLAGSVDANVVFVLKNDVGAIISAPNLKVALESEGSFSLELEKPQNTESVAPTTSNETASGGASTASGFVLVYWREQDCLQGSWEFKLNPVFAPQNVTNVAQCGYSANNINGMCQLGCNTEKSAQYFNRSEEEIAIPKNIPSEFGPENKIREGCYNVVKLKADANSFALNNVKNGETYKAFAYVLNSAQNLSLGRSLCVNASAREIPIASKEKGASVKRSECFVVSAAAGRSGSLSVHRWRVVRDNFLAKFKLGKLFINWYKINGPKMADWLDAHEALKPALNKAFELSGGAVLWGLNFSEKISPKIKIFFGFPEDAKASENETPPKGSASGHFYLFGGVGIPIEDKKLYNTYYAKKKPVLLFIGQTYRLFDAGGEFGIGLEGMVAFHNGKVPTKDSTGQSIDPKVVGEKIGYYSIGLLGTANYRLRIGELPWVAPFASVGIGAQRFREEQVKPKETSNAEGTTKITPAGAEGWSGVVNGRLGLAFSLVNWDGYETAYGYGLHDFMLSLYTGINKDFATKTLRQSYLNFGGGFSLYFW